jgi:signal transduction histidine kinase
MIHFKKYLIIFLLYLCHIITPAYTQNTSSAEQELLRLKSESKALSDTKDKVEKLLQIASIYENLDLDSSYHYNELALILSEKIKYWEGIIQYARSQSYIQNLKGQFESGLKILQKGYEAALKSEDKSAEASMTANIGISYSYLGQFNDALQQFFKAIDICDAAGDRLRKAKILSVVAGTFNNMAKSLSLDSTFLTKSIEYGLQSLQIARELKDSILIADNLVNIANTYNNLEDTEAAKPFAHEGHLLSKQLGLTPQYTQSLSVLSKIARKDKNIPLAIQYGEEAVNLQRLAGGTLGLVNSLKELALSYESAGSYSKALNTISEAEDLAMSNDMNYVLDGIFINKANYLFHNERYKDAYKYLLRGHTLADSLRGSEIKNQINELEKKYETAKKEQEILKLNNKQKQNRWIIIGLLLALTALSTIGYIWYKNMSYKTRIIEQEKEQLKNEQKIQATASIIKVQEEERYRLARDLHDGLGGMLSGLKYTLNNMGENVVLSDVNVKAFDNALYMLDQAIAEMRKVAHNMMPESLLKFGLDETLKDFVSKLNASLPLRLHYQSYNYRKLDQSLEINLYRIIQEVINNAIKHSQAEDLFIQMDYNEDTINLTLEDNGKGFDTSDRGKNQGIGLKNISDRVDYLNGKLEINSAPGKGTLIVIEIKTPKS